MCLSQAETSEPDAAAQQRLGELSVAARVALRGQALRAAAGRRAARRQEAGEYLGCTRAVRALCELRSYRDAKLDLVPK